MYQPGLLEPWGPRAQNIWEDSRAIKPWAPWAGPVAILVNVHVIDETGLACFQRHGSGSTVWCNNIEVTAMQAQVSRSPKQGTAEQVDTHTKPRSRNQQKQGYVKKLLQGAAGQWWRKQDPGQRGAERAGQAPGLILQAGNLVQD
ncbi:hypothetical protein NOR_02105 [Metarhizium rileyi]|uniref:Uncharacterized protein n=1 Tax=Metarhizium rileyi (strain RCEF 4871) TaxID=1649241 RepID=A0A167H8K9_METRR|nr:hypothetical protein NOR_02105 [Metarhizium rileyi RCEF 4871]